MVASRAPELVNYPVPHEPDDAAAMRFVAALGAAMAAANHPVTLVRNTMVTTSRAYGLETQYLALASFVQVGSSGSGGRLFTSYPDEDPRFDQTFPLATIVAQAQTGAVTPAEGRRSASEPVGAQPLSGLPPGRTVSPR